MVGDDAVATAYLWDCASAYNLRSMIYRREAILDALTQSETTGQEELAAQAKKEWSIENTSLSVCIMRMINPVVSGTAFSADTATGCRGTVRKDLVSIDTSYGLGEAVVGGRVTPDKLYVYQKDDGSEVVIRFMGSKTMKIVYDENGGTKEVPVPERVYALGPDPHAGRAGRQGRARREQGLRRHDHGHRVLHRLQGYAVVRAGAPRNTLE